MTYHRLNWTVQMRVLGRRIRVESVAADMIARALSCWSCSWPCMLSQEKLSWLGGFLHHMIHQGDAQADMSLPSGPFLDLNMFNCCGFCQYDEFSFGTVGANAVNFDHDQQRDLFTMMSSSQIPDDQILIPLCSSLDCIGKRITMIFIRRLDRVVEHGKAVWKWRAAHKRWRCLH